MTIINPKRETRKRRAWLVARFALIALGMLLFLGWTGQTFPY